MNPEEKRRIGEIQKRVERIQTLQDLAKKMRDGAAELDLRLFGERLTEDIGVKVEVAQCSAGFDRAPGDIAAMDLCLDELETAMRATDATLKALSEL